jgi:hypothetical protein
MMPVDPTRHAMTRLAQRGFSPGDIEMIIEIGTEVGNGCYLMRERDWQEIERRLKRFIDRGRRLVGKYVVTSGDRLITAYHPHSVKERRLLRRAEERALIV